MAKSASCRKRASSGKHLGLVSIAAIEKALRKRAYARSTPDGLEVRTKVSDLPLLKLTRIKVPDGIRYRYASRRKHYKNWREAVRILRPVTILCLMAIEDWDAKQAAKRPRSTRRDIEV
jgi:hypothetical protein